MLDDVGNEIDKDFLNFFLEETHSVLGELKICLNHFNKTEDPKSFEQFGQKVDRIMGASYTLSLNFFGDLAKMGKEIGYKSSQLKDIEKLFVIQSLLSQLVKAMERILKQFKKGIHGEMGEYQILLERLQEANKDLGNLRATVQS